MAAETLSAIKRIAGALALGAGLVAASPASADAPPPAGIFVTGNDLWASCNSPSQVFCAGYIAAIADILGTGKLALRACLPGTATLPDLIDLAKRYLAEHPDERAYTAYSVVSYALLQRFPCPPKWLKQDPAG
jgi:hypothetical protein